MFFIVNVFFQLEDAQKAGIGNKESLNLAAKVFTDLSEGTGTFRKKQIYTNILLLLQF
jgi:hypothetical protein